jgi:hypothetical protein
LISQSPAREGHDQEILDARIQHAALLKSQGYLLIRQRKWVEAEEVSRRLIQLRDLINPSGERAIEAFIQLGTALQKQGKWHEAEGICEQISKLLKEMKGIKNKRERNRVAQLRIQFEDMMEKQESFIGPEDI